MNGCFLKSFHFSHRKTQTSWKYSTMSRGFFLAFFCYLSLMTSAQASELQIEIVDSWVEDGYIFHIDFQVPPYHVNCTTTGAGFIGFNVYYKDPRSLQGDWTFGLAPWPEGLVSDFKVGSHLTAYGPQGFCTRFSPCIIQNVQMVKAWCPPLGGVSDSTE
jgi:hypothetical protein